MKQEIANIIQLPKIFDPRGSLTVAEEMKNIPFHIKNVEWRYGMHEGKTFGQGKNDTQQVIVALFGSFTVKIHDAREEETFMMNHPYQGLYLNKEVEFEIKDCSEGVVILILTE